MFLLDSGCKVDDLIPAELTVECKKTASVVPDERKPGGAYVTETGVVRHISITERVLVMESGTEIPMEDVDSVVF